MLNYLFLTNNIATIRLINDYKNIFLQIFIQKIYIIYVINVY